ncbi:hypothetical protein RV11_GL002851 [Enterococcus phoeniculicola]|jgi:transcriptional regulator with XRE-family HTH domain|uniref:HTH cro/C1-type domain-containing protein n=1 Tax=Enterococcus phoeniculicola ATCC BAA-412 TaxID=1158610 RepID=R3W1U1_9ENTE|nr:helix-turn-helix transcriptional regulator [Enterococcus phoeniculicola]EOL41627.1 hypothetical protein UC3_03191 [Enterococcus phoeniculicola ATCC BAA-412]EOT78879.1 hypothetical protein I589_00385 [Enterococcus phoeniculicola ATCC BAA-412]OJG72712.1 hypothetical protein RV11_GL002851 [Enterococcus phoeniculicola]
MSVFDRIKQLSEQRGKSVSQVAVELGFSENLFYQWKTASPKSDRLEKVADYFHVSTDYLLGRTNSPSDSSQSLSIDEDGFISHFRLNTANMNVEDTEELEEELKEYMDFLIQKAMDKKKRRNK